MANINPIEVTFLFSNEAAFQKFVKKHCNDEYTYRKGKYIVDMTDEVKRDAAAVTEEVPAPVTEEPKVEAVPEVAAEPAPSESMF